MSKRLRYFSGEEVMVGDVVYLDARSARARTRRPGSVATVLEIIDHYLPGMILVKWIESFPYPDGDVPARALVLIKRKDER